jgi:hypothetical protein
MACADSISSADKGKTWKIPTIRVEQSKAPEQYLKGAKMASGSGLCRKTK